VVSLAFFSLSMYSDGMQNQEEEEKEILLQKKRVQNLKQEEERGYDSPGEKNHPNN
jgi:hypothetical protein